MARAAGADPRILRRRRGRLEPALADSPHRRYDRSRLGAFACRYQTGDVVVGIDRMRVDPHKEPPAVSEGPHRGVDARRLTPFRIIQEDEPWLGLCPFFHQAAAAIGTAAI